MDESGERRQRPVWQAPPAQTGPDGRRAAGVARVAALIAVWWATAAGLAILSAQAATDVRRPGPARVEDVVALACAGAGLAGCWWLAVAALASIAAALLGARRPSSALARAVGGVARRTAPPGLRRAAVLAVGLTLGGITSPALAAPRSALPTAAGRPAPPAAAAPLDPGWGSAATAAGQTAQPVLDPGWVPAAPEPRAHPATDRAVVTMPGPATRPRHAARSEIVVRRGDTLWAVVERHLGPHCTAAQVAAEWPRWHAANRTVIGPDPDVLLPGQRLRPPGAARSADVPTRSASPASASPASASAASPVDGGHR